MKKAEIQAFGIPAVKWWWEEAPGGLPGTHNQRLESYRDNIKRIRENIGHLPGFNVVTVRGLGYKVEVD